LLDHQRVDHAKVSQGEMRELQRTPNSPRSADHATGPASTDGELQTTVPFGMLVDFYADWCGSL